MAKNAADNPRSRSQGSKGSRSGSDLNPLNKATTPAEFAHSSLRINWRTISADHLAH